jgi:hypothetical protein
MTAVPTFKWTGFDVADVARWLIAIALLLLFANPSAAQVTGNVSVMYDILPDVSAAAGSQPVNELRTHAFAEWRRDVGRRVRVNISGYVDGLLADRSATSGSTSERTAIARPGDVYVDLLARRFDLRVGASRLVWGRLDEIQPTDVVNPIDLTRFLLEGRSEARLPVGLIRGRWFLPHSSTLEGVLVPAFRASRFDQLAEDSSPFNLADTTGFDVVRTEPERHVRTVQGGARFSATSGRVDWAATVYRGYRTFPTLTVVPTFAPPPLILETFPRFTMIGGDFETVRGVWGVRGELAAFVRDELQSTQLAQGVAGRSVDAGVGIDRKAGDYRIAGEVLWSWRGVLTDDDDDPRAARAIASRELNGNDVSLVLSADRSFARETRTLRVFAVHDPADETTFARVIAAISLRDNVWLEGSGGLFTGESNDTLGRLGRRDFVYTRLKVFF